MQCWRAAVSWRIETSAWGGLTAKAAFRLAAYAFTVHLVSWAILARHSLSFGEESGVFQAVIGMGVFGSGLLWICYLALEPYARRCWPWGIISWNRLLAGRLRDPLVGQHVLIGGLVGVSFALLLQLQVLLPGWLGLAASSPFGGRADLLTKGPAILILGQLDALFPAMGQVFTLVVFLVVLRKKWLAVGLAFLLNWAAIITRGVSAGSAMTTPVDHPVIGGIVIALGLILVYFVLLRFGFLAHVIGLYYVIQLTTGPITTHFSAWYGSGSLLCLLALSALAIYGFVVSWGGRPLFRVEI